MLRVALIVLLLAGVVTANPTPGSWQAENWGQDPEASKLPSNPGSRTSYLDVYAGATASMVDAYLYTSISTGDQQAIGSDKATAWFGLKFVGSPNATNHKWKIITKITGFGWAYAEAVLEASCWGESLQYISVTGDNTNKDGGQLAVQDNAKVNLAISLPKSLSITFPKAARALTRDEFRISNSVCTMGSGKACRVRVDNKAQARGAAASTVQVAAVLMKADLDVEIEMIGFCDFAGLEITDRLLLSDAPDDGSTAEVTPPTGGMVRGEGEVPTDMPTEDEREGKDTSGPTIDAGDLPKVLPHDFEDKPPVDSGAKVEGD